MVGGGPSQGTESKKGQIWFGGREDYKGTKGLREVSYGLTIDGLATGVNYLMMRTLFIRI